MLELEDLTLDDISALADIINEKHLGRIELKNGERSVVLDSHPPMPPHMPIHGAEDMQMMHMPPFPPKQFDPMPGTFNSAAADAHPSVETQTAHNGNVVKSPIVGTYYAAPAPGKPPFVTVGSKVRKGDTIMIIESMKLMNEVQSEFDGVVERILVSDGDAVEFDQPIMIIK